MKVLYVVNSSVFFCSHFLVLAEQVKRSGSEVFIIAGDAVSKSYLEGKGFHFTCIEISRKGLNPANELLTIISLYKAIHLICPDIMHMFTIKPIIYAGLINKLFPNIRVPSTVASITGLGSAALSNSWKGRTLWFVLKGLYKFALSLESTKVIFENCDDKDQLVNSFIVPLSRTFLVNGAGVDTSIFCPPPFRSNKSLTVVLVARLLKDKGIREFIKAGEILQSQGANIRLELVGAIDEGNISSMSKHVIELAHKQGHVEYLGQRSDIAKIYQKADVACLPSYREGLPKSLIEAASCGLAIVTTDVPGCRQMVFGGENGVLIKPYSAESIVEKLLQLAKEPEKVVVMGVKSREKALELFDHSSIIASFFNIYGLTKSK